MIIKIFTKLKILSMFLTGCKFRDHLTLSKTKTFLLISNNFADIEV